MLQLDADLHDELKKFCNEKGYKMKGLVQSLIKERIYNKPSGNILKSKNIKV